MTKNSNGRVFPFNYFHFGFRLSDWFDIWVVGWFFYSGSKILINLFDVWILSCHFNVLFDMVAIIILSNQDGDAISYICS